MIEKDRMQTITGELEAIWRMEEMKVVGIFNARR
jgi:hypothetical protein